jgi:hypothetical protein
MSLASIAPGFISDDPMTKTLDYYEKFDQFFSHHAIEPAAILEIGVYQGQSTKVFATRYPNATIVALDLELRPIDFSGYPNVKYLQCDQADQNRLNEIISAHFPQGIDLVIEDASHIGALSTITFHTVFPRLKSGGLYIVEDWGTGYWDSWIDGGRYQQFPLGFYERQLPLRIPSHDFGMVGFVKSLVDYSHESAIRLNQHDKPGKQARLKLLQFTEGLCFALKA